MTRCDLERTVAIIAFDVMTLEKVPQRSEEKNCRGNRTPEGSVKARWHRLQSVIISRRNTD